MATNMTEVWKAVAAEFGIQPDTVRRRWSRYADRVPGATDPKLCTLDEYVDLLIDFGQVATNNPDPKAREQWVRDNQHRFIAAKVEAEEVIDVALDDLLDNAAPSSALALATTKNQNTLALAQSGLEDAYAELCFVVDKLQSLQTAPTGKTEIEKDAIATQRLTQELKDETDIQVRIAKMRQALLGNAA